MGYQPNPPRPKPSPIEIMEAGAHASVLKAIASTGMADVSDPAVKDAMAALLRLPTPPIDPAVRELAELLGEDPRNLLQIPRDLANLPRRSAWSRFLLKVRKWINAH